MKLKYDHAYTADPRHRFHKRLKDLGFRHLPNEVEHPGKHYCRFIAFRERMNELPVYLEFIDARDPSHPIGCPGLSLRALGSLETFFHSLTRKGVNGRFVHKNYDWKKDAKSQLPGWNFVTFKNLGFRTVFPWITEYEPRPRSRRKKIGIQKHPNTIRRLIAVEVDVNSNGQKFFEKLLSRKLIRPVRLPGGQTFHFTKSKTTNIRSIVVEAVSLDKARKFISGPETDWRGRPALKIENPSGHWNLLVVER